MAERIDVPSVLIENFTWEWIYQAYLDGLAPVFAATQPDVAEENIQARIRGNLMMALSHMAYEIERLKQHD